MSNPPTSMYTHIYLGSITTKQSRNVLPNIDSIDTWAWTPLLPCCRINTLQGETTHARTHTHIHTRMHARAVGWDRCLCLFWFLLLFFLHISRIALLAAPEMIYLTKEYQCYQ